VATPDGSNEAVRPRPCCDRHHGAAEGGDFPTDAKLLNRARERLVRLVKKLGVSLRQSYRRVGKLALIKTSATPMPISSSAPTGAYASSRPILAASSATSSGTSLGTKVCGSRSCGRCSWPDGCWNKTGASAVARSIPCTRQRSSRQGQGASALRVRGQSERRHHSEAFRWRPVCCPCRSVARQPL
jgi:hypothetical protein